NPEPDVLWNFANGYAHIHPKHVAEPLDATGEGMKKTIVGTGPFKYVRGAEGESYVLARNDNYFRPGKPYFDGIEIYPISDITQQTAALETGKIDMIEYLENVPELDRLAKNKDLTVISRSEERRVG